MNKKMFDNQIIIKLEPELRHVLAHIIMAIEDNAKNRPLTALDNVKSIEGLIMFDGKDPLSSEKFYKQRG